MGYRRALRVACWGPISAGVLTIGISGCALVPPNSFLDPTKVGRFGLDARESGIRTVLTTRDTPPGLAHATEPTAKDVAPVYDEYRLVPGDAVSVVIYDLITPGGTPWQAAIQVSSLGEIRIPEIGSVRVAGLTEQEAEQEIIARLKDSGVLPKPVVQMFVQTRRGRMFTIIGAVAASGPYQINDPDLRLLDAVGMAGDVAATAKRIYIIRRESAGSMEPTAEPKAAETERDLIVPPPNDVAPGSLMTSAGRGTQEPASARAPEPPTKQELANVMTPTARSQPATRGGETRPQSPLEPLIFDPETGQVLEAKRPAPAPGPERAAAPRQEPPAAERLEEPFDWQAVNEYELEQRVIAIDVSELKAGNPRYNIVVRDRDVINVPQDTGVFYVTGEVTRPGVYAFGGRDITVKQALAIVGGFAPMAWPQRCEVIRREPGTDKQLTMTVNLDAIFAGLEEDFYLRDDDIVNVGSHIVAPFLYVVRNSFRFTYGFGFVYDRNFADKDAYNARANPETIDQARKATRGLSY